MRIVTTIINIPFFVPSAGSVLLLPHRPSSETRLDTLDDTTVALGVNQSVPLTLTSPSFELPLVHTRCPPPRAVTMRARWVLLSCSAAGGAPQHVTGRSTPQWRPRRRFPRAVCQALGDREESASAGPPEALSALHEEPAVASGPVSSLVVLPPQPSELQEWPLGTKRTDAGLQL